jgi:hypothetical protein
MEAKMAKMATTVVSLDKDKSVVDKKGFMDSLEANLTCWSCAKVPRKATVSMCTGNHLMCQNCYPLHVKKFDACNPRSSGAYSVCKYYCANCSHCTGFVQCGKGACKFYAVPAFSLLVQTLLNELPAKCKFTHNGCQVALKLHEIVIHEVDCVYRNINCPFLNCTDKTVTFIGLSEHLKAKHGDLKKIGKAKSKDIIPLPVPEQATRLWNPQELIFRSRLFFTEIHRVAASPSRYFWIYFHGTPKEAAHYSYKIKIIGGNGKELSFKGKVFSMNVTKETIFVHDDVFILCDVQARRLQVDGKINFEINLYSDMEEIKNEDVESGISDVDD